MKPSNTDLTGLEIAVVAIAGRFPGAADVETLWRKLRAGEECIETYTADDLRRAGADPAILERPGWVPASGFVEGYDLFDAGFFDLTPREAEILDPQQRLFLECAWEALERAGHVPERFAGTIGVYAGAKFNDYLIHLFSNPEVRAAIGDYALMVASDRDYLATRVSYQLGLRGPSVGVQTACSTSLVAVHLASQALLAGECDLALAGGVSLALPYRWGYPYSEGGVFSPDGKCRAFDARAQGTVAGSGLGLVALRRLEDAIEDGDRILAVIKGSAINNDGDLKIGFTAPSVDGQERAIRAAQEIAEVEPETIGYVECHGTATPLGDPIEIEALTRAFRAGTDRRRFCALGSLKTNIGHLDPAAGVAGLIKAVLMLDHGELAPSLHYTAPNPQIDFDSSPFYVNTEHRPWPRRGAPRRAGVSSFGIGGTNAHVVLEEAPAREPSGDARAAQLLLVSARTEPAVETACGRLAELCAERDESLPELADVAYTLSIGRRHFAHRRALVCSSFAEAAEILGGRDRERISARLHEGGEPRLAFVFAGQGAQHPGMGRALYDGEAVYRAAIDEAAEVLRPLLAADLRGFLFPPSGDGPEEAAERLRRTSIAQPALVATEIALLRLWSSWGIEAEVALGHSIGELTAAHWAGVFDFATVLELVAERGRLMEQAPAGAMLSVPLSLDEAEELGIGETAIAAINGPADLVLSGAEEAIAELAERLDSRGISHRRLHTSHAFHSPLMDAVLPLFEERVAAASPQPPRRPFYSNVSGEPITAEAATDPAYWASQLRRPVRFAAAIDALWKQPRRVILEVGPGVGLGNLARRSPRRPAGAAVVSSLPASGPAAGDALRSVLAAAGALWTAGVELDWPAFFGEQRRSRMLLPTYPFERQRYWIEAQAEPPRALPDGGSARPLAEPGAQRAETSAEPQASGTGEPATALERSIAEVWRSSLGIESIGVHENYFELGGSSLLATRLVARIGETVGAPLALSELLEHPTIEGLARVLEERVGRPADGEREALRPIEPDIEGRDLPFPLTDVQQAYWIGRQGQLDLGNVSTHSYLELDAEGLDLERLEHSLVRLIERQGMLRAVFLPDGTQRILPQVPRYEIEVIDLVGHDREEADEVLASVREAMSHQVLDSETWPLFEVRAARLGEARYRLFFSFDFLLGDAWSLEILVRELSAFYLDPELEAPPLELSFRDYVLAERELETSAPFERSLAYWKERLETLPGGPELPLARSLAEIDRPRFVRRHARLDEATWGRLKTRAAAAGLTPSALLAAAFSEVLARWSAQPRFTLSLTLFNRLPLHPEVDRLIGDFTSVVLLERDPDGDSFAARAQRLQSRLWRDLDHRFVSGVRVVRELAQLRGRAGALSLPVVFTSLLGMEQPEPEGGGPRAAGEAVSVRTVHSISQTPQVLLDHQVEERDGVLAFNWDAVEEVFAPGLLDDLFATYRRLLDRLGDSEDWGDALLHDLLPDEHRSVRERANATETAVSGQTLHGLFAAQLHATPEATAVIDGERRLTYEQLARRVRALRAEIEAHGPGPGRLIAIVLDKGWRQAVAALAILEAGAAYLPISPTLPEARRRLLLEQGEADLVVTSPRLERTLGWPADVVRLTVADDEPETAPAERPAANDRMALAYVIFTSGSTGTPKGVMIDHRGAVNTILDVNSRFGVGAEDRILALSALGFDLSVYDLFGALAAGATIVYPEPWAIPDPAGWLECAERDAVTVWNSVPALFEMVVELSEGRQAKLPSSLRLALLSGDWIPVDLAQRAQRLAPGLEVIGLGGATEASIWSILHRIEPRDADRPSVPYGLPMANQRFYVLDDRLAPRPLGVAGDLYIGGIGVALGYWRDAERTAAAFIEHPLSGERLYRTGDRGRYLANGEIEFLGRLDQQVKLHGHRIELGEIEAVLGAHPAVDAAVAAIVGGDGPGRRLAAWVTVGGEGAAGVEALSEHLRQRLPHYMVPRELQVVDEMPLTANGKVDRKALAARVADPPPSSARTAPSRPAAELLASLCADVLGLPRVRPQDNFFALGGHSLLATTLLSRVREAFGVELALRDVFEADDLDALARTVEAARRRLHAVEVPPVTRDASGRIELSFAQRRLWFLKQLAADSPVYNVNLGIDLEGKLELEVLQASLDEIVRRHEILRTVIPAHAGQPAPRLEPPSAVPIALVDLQRLADGDRRRVGQRLIDRALVLPVPVDRSPVLRVYLFRHAASRHVLLGMTHHILWDDWSEGIFWYELGTLYRAFQQDEPSPLEPLPIQYSDFAAWQLDWFESEVRQRQWEYWRGQLEGAPAMLELPTDRPRPAEQTFDGSSVSLPLSRELLEALRELGRRRGATLFMVLLTAFKLMLARLSGQSDLVVGTLVGNRNRPEIEPLIGFFVNTLALRTDLSGDPSFGEALARVRRVALEGYDHQDFPLEKLIEELKLRRDLGYTPLTQVVFNQFSAGRREVELPGLRMSGIAGEVGWAPFDVAFTLLGDDQQSILHTQYSTDLFDRTTIERWLRHLHALLVAALDDPEASVASLPIASPAQRHQMLFEWSGAAGLRPADGSLSELFAAVAQAAPDSPAVIDGDSVLSYGELGARADRVASALLAAGVRPDAPVAVGVGRSASLVVALLAVVRAGGAYLPLDPAYPDHRLRYMIENSGAGTLLVDAPSRARFDGLLEAAGAPRRVELESALEHREEARLPRPDAEQLCYVVYTSGSTGRPKGVAIAHRGVVRLLHRPEFVTLRPGDRIAMLSNASFDALTLELWGPLLNGATIVVLDSEQALSGPRLGELIERHEIDTVHLTAAVLGGLAERRAQSFDGLRQLYFGGEAANPAAIEKLLGPHGPRSLVQLYGPTEGTAFAAFERVRRVDVRRPTLPLGRPVQGSTLYLLDRRLSPVLPGAHGELYIGGPGLARGYLGRPARTAASFVPDPFGDRPGGRLYATGDLARQLADGRFEFLGRRDAQVKLRGFRVELGEIEALIRRRPEVSEALAMVHHTAAGGRQLVAYYVADEACDEALEAELAARLPAYMLPQSLLHLEALPLTPNGKVDRDRLPDPGATRDGSPASPRAPEGEVETLLLAIWREVLGDPEIGVGDNFFDLGGDSILTIQLTARAEELGLSIAPNLIFRHQTVAELATQVTPGERREVDRAPAAGEAPLLPIQEHFFELGLASPHHFNHAMLFAVAGEVSGESLRAALAALAPVHDVLRVRFERCEGRWRQVFAPPRDGATAAAVDEVDLRPLGDAAREAERALYAGAQTSLALAGPLLRVLAVHAPEGDRLFVVAHHLIVDGVSWRILLADLGRLLAAAQGAAMLPPRSTSPARWAQLLAERASSPQLLAELDHWESTGAAAGALPLDDESASGLAADTRQVVRELDAETTTALLQRAGDADGGRTEEVLLTAAARALAGWTRQRRVALWLERHGREEAENVDLGRTVGWLTSRFPLLLEADPADDPAAALAATRDRLRAVPGDGLGYGILRHLSDDREVRERLARAAEPQVAFNYLGQLDLALDRGSIFEPLDVPLGDAVAADNRREHPLEINLMVRGGRLRCFFAHDRRLRRETVEALATTFVAELRGLVGQGLQRDAATLTPEDFPAADLSQEELDAILSRLD